MKGDSRLPRTTLGCMGFKIGSSSSWVISSRSRRRSKQTLCFWPLLGVECLTRPAHIMISFFFSFFFFSFLFCVCWGVVNMNWFRLTCGWKDDQTRSGLMDSCEKHCLIQKKKKKKKKLIVECGPIPYCSVTGNHIFDVSGNK